MKTARIKVWIEERLWFVRVAALALWVCWIGWLVYTQFFGQAQSKQIFTDHMAFYSAAKLIQEGQGDRIYDYGFLGNYQPQLMGQEGFVLSAYRNPPFYALWFMPTAGFPYMVSFWIWSLISVVLLGAGVYWLRPQNYARTLVWAFTFPPVFSTFGFGQNTLYSFGVLCGCFALLEKKRKFWAGFVAGILLYKPQLLLGLCLWWLIEFRKYGQCLLGLTVTGLVYLAASWFFVWPETLDYIQQLPMISSYCAFDYWNLHNPRGFWSYLFGDDKAIGHPLGTVTSGIALVLALVWWYHTQPNQMVMFCAIIYFTLWASPHTMIYEWALLLIPAILLWERFPQKRDGFLVWYALAWVVLFIGSPLAKFQHETFGPGGLHISVPILAVVGIQILRQLNQTDLLISTNHEENWKQAVDHKD